MEAFKGIVTESTGSRYKVRLEDGSVADCQIRGRLRLRDSRTTNPVAVGDVVSLETETGGDTVITNIEPRRNYLIRRSSNLSKESHIIAANIDHAFIMVTLYAPATSNEFIDRFLVTCEAYSIPASIILNKCDMLAGAEDVVDEFCAVYASAGYEVLRISAREGAGLERLAGKFKNRTSLLTGNSGVGKSTLIKAIEPGLDVKIGEISKFHRKGMHTTTFACMYPLSGGGYLIDTPGIKGFGLIDIEAGEVFRYFPEFMALAPQCQFYNCTHTHEPGCAVREAVESGEISQSRYVSYLKLLDEDEKYRK